MTEYTPTTEQVRRGYVTGLRQAFIGGQSEHAAEFDRWLAQVKAEAWDEGFEGGYFHGAYLKPRPTNPYRECLTQCPHGFHHPRPYSDYPHSCDGCWCEGERDRRDYGWAHDTSPDEREDEDDEQ